MNVRWEVGSLKQNYVILTPFYLDIQVLSQIADTEIKIYEFPDCDSDEDEEYRKQASLSFNKFDPNNDASNRCENERIFLNLLEFA